MAAAAVDPAGHFNRLQSDKFALRVIQNLEPNGSTKLNQNGSPKWIVGKRAKTPNKTKFVIHEKKILSGLENPCKDQIAHMIRYNNTTNELFTNYKADGDLFKYLFEPVKVFNPKKELNEQAVIKIFIDVCNAVNCLHKNGYYHLDLKFENVLISKKDGSIRVFLTDFELTQHSENPPECVIDDDHPFIGTIGYTLDNIIIDAESRKQGQSVKINGFHADLYALCVMLYTLILEYSITNEVCKQLLLNMLFTANNDNPLFSIKDTVYPNKTIYNNLNELITAFTSLNSKQSNTPTLVMVEDILIERQINIFLHSYRILIEQLKLLNDNHHDGMSEFIKKYIKQNKPDIILLHYELQVDVMFICMFIYFFTNLISNDKLLKDTPFMKSVMEYIEDRINYIDKYKMNQFGNDIIRRFMDELKKVKEAAEEAAKEAAKKAAQLLTNPISANNGENWLAKEAPAQPAAQPGGARFRKKHTRRKYRHSRKSFSRTKKH
jgi:serine/threonine protein kinase